jgi:hypothetical protein
MKQFFPILFLALACTANPDGLRDKKIAQDFNKKDTTLILNYNAISCTCAQWSESKYNDKPDIKKYYYLVRANKRLINADNLWRGDNLPLQIKVIGRIVTTEGFPKDFKQTKGKLQPGKVFRYTKIIILQDGENKTPAK